MGPLEGVLVLDLTQVLSGPYCTMLLADMGADVIKVEPPEGDSYRKSGPPFINGESAAFLAVNRGKKSVVLDLKTPAGRQALLALAVRADVLVENFKPSSLPRLGLGYDTVSELNPRLVYCSLSGFGATGPYRERGGFDLIIQGMSGIMSFTGEPGRPPAKVGLPVVDVGSGMCAALGICLAYVARLRTDKGQHVDASLFDTALSWLSFQAGTFFASGEPPRPMGSAHQVIAPYQTYATADGYINIGGASERMWDRLRALLGHEEWAGNPLFASNAARMQHLEELREAIEAELTKQPSSYWLARLEEAGIPAGPIYDLNQVFADPQVAARDMIQELEHPVAGRYRTVGLPLKLSGTPGAIQSRPPLLGEHTAEVLARFGIQTS